MKLTITHNGFHGTRSRSIIVDGNPDDEVALTELQIWRLGRVACGHPGCTCGETMLVACSDWGMTDYPHKIRIPADGAAEICVEGYYPQR